MRSITAILLILLSLTVLTACAAENPSGGMSGESAAAGETPRPVMHESAGGADSMATAEYHALSAQEAKARMDGGDAIAVLDVRSAEEYAAGHIPGAILLPNEQIGTEPPAQLPDLNAEILIYCRSGNRSRQAAEKLVAMGYTAVYDFGGINGWPYETTTD